MRDKFLAIILLFILSLILLLVAEIKLKIISKNLN